MSEGFKLINLSKLAGLELEGFPSSFGLDGLGKLINTTDFTGQLKLGPFLFNINTTSKYTWYYRYKYTGTPIQTALFEVIYSVGGTFFISVNTATGDVKATYDGGTTRTSTLMSADTTHDIFITLKNAVWKIYIDGSEASYSSNNNLSANMTGTTSGSLSNFCCQMDGVAEIEDFYFWENRVLVSSEISAYDKDVDNLNPTHAYEFNESATNTGFTYANSASGHLIQDAIRIETPENPQFFSQRSSQGDLQSTLLGSKSDITLELDLMSRLDYTKLRRDLHDRTEPHKLFLDFPAQESQIINFEPINSEVREESSSDSDLDYNTGTATELTSDQYDDLNNPTGDDITLTTTDKFQYMFFNLDIVDFKTTRTSDPIKRITLAYKNLYSSDLNGDGGIIFHAFDVVNSNWVEIKRQSITIDSDYTGFASIRPVDGFEDMGNFLNGAIVLFRVRNLVENPDQGTSNVTLKIRYAKGFVNGYGVVFTGADNATYRDTFIEQGYVQTLNFLEL